MKKFETEKIKNICLLGHGSSGKSTLADTILYISGNTDRIGNTENGSLTMDFDAEEKKRGISISTSVYQFEYNDKKINLIDVPGLFDFAGGVNEALIAADSALIALSGKSGLTVGAKLNYASAKKYGVPVAFFVGKLNSPRAYFYRVISSLTAQYGATICPVTVPIEKGEEVVGYVNLIDNKQYTFDGVKATEVPLVEDDNVKAMREVMLEAVAAVDENLMEKYFGGEEFTKEEILSALSRGMLSGDISPVFCGINQTGEGISLMMDILSEIAPGSLDRKYKIIKDGAEGETECNANGSPLAVVFKTVADPFVGKLSYIKVVSGKITADTKLINQRTKNEEKLGKPMWLKGGKQEDADEAVAGDIVCFAKLGNVATCDTLYAGGIDTQICCGEFPKPCLSMCIKPTKKGEEEKIAQGLLRLMEEDLTLSFEVNNETKEQIISGLGEQHLDVVATKLKSKFGVDVVLSPAKVAYRETIRKKVKVQGRHKKQSGGHGQFGDVWIEFEPCDSEELVFEEKVFGGAVPKNFFPAVEKGLRDCTLSGPLAGYPVVGVKATLVDGSYHPVDSSEMSFKMAAAIAFKAGIPDASPVLLEPIGSLTVNVPDDIMGDVIGDINKRRGRILGMNPGAEAKTQDIMAEVPMAEMGDFATAMRSIAQGRAVFTFTFERYEEAPSHIASAVIAENNQ